MLADPPQVVNTGTIFAGYQNVIVTDSQFMEVLHLSIFSPETCQ